MGEFLTGNMRPNGLGLFQHVVREDMREMVFTDDDLDIYSEVVLVTEDLDHAATWILRGRRPISDFDIHDHSLEIGDCCPSSFVPQYSMGGGLRRLFGFGYLLAG